MKHFPENINPDLLIAFLSKETMPEQDLLVKEWIMASEENKKQFEALRSIWENSDGAVPLTDVNTDAAWQKLSGRIEEAEKPVMLPMKKTGMRRLLIAASLIPLLILVYVFLFRDTEPRLLSVTTGKDKQEITLPDGSKVVLNVNSTLTYPEEFESGNREISLTGEAFFTVSPDKARPFIVNTGQTFVKVTGTSFNVRNDSKSRQVEVFVKTGKVFLVLKDNTDSIALLPGNKGVYNPGSDLLRIDTTSTENDLFWMDRILVYRKTPLNMVFEELGECYGIDIIAEDSTIGELKLTSTFSNQPADEILDVIALSFNLNVSRSGKQYTIGLKE